MEGGEESSLEETTWLGLIGEVAFSTGGNQPGHSVSQNHAQGNHAQNHVLNHAEGNHVQNHKQGNVGEKAQFLISPCITSSGCHTES